MVGWTLNNLRVFYLQMVQTLTLPTQTFDKVQGKIYTDINGKKCQVKTRFSLNDIYMESKRLKISFK